jgi:hypothetical protein
MENAEDLAPGADYPRTFQEVDEWFRSDEVKWLTPQISQLGHVKISASSLSGVAEPRGAVNQLYI